MTQPPNSDTSILRERWLPLVVEIAHHIHWQLHGEQLEHFVDQVAPYLAQPGVTTPSCAIAVMRNYYQDAALIALLSAEEDEERAAAWTIIEHVIVELLASQPRYTRRMRDHTLHERVRDTFQQELPHYTYQASLLGVLSRIVRSEAGSATHD